MNVDHIRGFLKRKPFKPFALKTASGEGHEITHLEAISISPEDDVLVLWPAKGGLVLVDIDQVTEAAYPSRKVN